MSSSNQLLDGYQKFLEEIKESIRECLSRGPSQLIDIVRHCKGAYPTLVIDCLSSMSSETVVSAGSVYSLINKNKDQSFDDSVLNALEGNPTLCSWYFTSETCSRIVKLRDWSELNLAFLGTPRLYESFLNRDLGKKRLLLDADKVVLETLLNAYSNLKDTIEWYDVAEEIPANLRNSFDCVFLDPPWYPMDYLLWIKRAIELAPRGVLFFSLFPELTRPTAKEERNYLLESTLNLWKSSLLLSSFAEYEVPSYERAELMESGVLEIRPWKVADFAVMELYPDAPFTDWNIQTTKTLWREIDINSFRIFIDTNTKGDSTDDLLSIPNGQSMTLLSPSRRNPTLKEVNVLTSRGHGLITSRPEELIEKLIQLRNIHLPKEPWQETINRSDFDSSTRYILTNILQEIENA